MMIWINSDQVNVDLDLVKKNKLEIRITKDGHVEYSPKSMTTTDGKTELTNVQPYSIIRKEEANKALNGVAIFLLVLGIFALIGFYSVLKAVLDFCMKQYRKRREKRVGNN